MTTEQTTENAKTNTDAATPPMTWGDAAAEAAQIDPPPKRFRQRLTVKLSDREVAEHAQRYADADAELEEFDAETKRLAGERKSARAEIEGRKKKHRQACSTRREDRDVECVENISIRQGRKWRVRLDTNETYEEEPLSESERQASLPLAKSDDGQLSIADAISTLKDPDGTGRTKVTSIGLDGTETQIAGPVDEASDEADVTDPAALLAAAEHAEPSEEDVDAEQDEEGDESESDEDDGEE